MNKIKWTIGLLLVFFLILGTNMIDKQNFRKVRNSVVAIYEDRLVTKNYLLELTHLLHEKEIANITSDTTYFNGKNRNINQNINQTLEDYITINLGRDEKRTAQKLQSSINELLKIETSDNRNSEDYQEQINQIKTSLGKLSDIQLKEGENQMFISKKALKNVEWYTQIEIYFLIILAVIIQIIILYQPKTPKIEVD